MGGWVCFTRVSRDGGVGEWEARGDELMVWGQGEG